MNSLVSLVQMTAVITAGVLLLVCLAGPCGISRGGNDARCSRWWGGADG